MQCYVNSQIIPALALGREWAHMRAEKNSDQGGIRTHDLQILITVAQLTEVQGQNRSRPWVLEIVFHGIEASN